MVKKFELVGQRLWSATRLFVKPFGVDRDRIERLATFPIRIPLG